MSIVHRAFIFKSGKWLKVVKHYTAHFVKQSLLFRRFPKSRFPLSAAGEGDHAAGVTANVVLSFTLESDTSR